MYECLILETLKTLHFKAPQRRHKKYELYEAEYVYLDDAYTNFDGRCGESPTNRSIKMLVTTI